MYLARIGSRRQGRLWGRLDKVDCEVVGVKVDCEVVWTRLTDKMTKTWDRKQTVTTTRAETGNQVKNVDETSDEPVVTTDTVS